LRSNQQANLHDLVSKMLEGDRRALSRLFSALERNQDSLPQLMRSIYPKIGHTYCIGITGPPGAGKSSMVDGLLRELRSEGASVGVIAVDPSSPFQGGAVLGDRIRMSRHYLDDQVFIRSLATKGAHGGLSQITGAAVHLLDAFGKDYVIVESVGVGQTELDVLAVADTVVVVLVPEAGDSVQTLKAGLMEIADVFVVNKSDRQGAPKMAAAIKGEVAGGRHSDWWMPPIKLTQAHNGVGVPELLESIKDHRAAGEKSSNLRRRRADRRRREFDEALRSAVLTRLATIESETGDLVSLVDQTDPYTAAEQVIADGWLEQKLAELLKPAENDE
jgi:LAO/AO transport system kinase